MPKLPIDYSKILIYKIEHINNEELVYVGHTTNWDKRKCMHKNACTNEKYKIYNLKVYQMIRANGGWEMFQMIEVEKYPCNDKREAERRENEIMKDLKASMNTKKSFLTKEESIKSDKEYYQRNKERIKNYYHENKEHINKLKSERGKEFYKNNKDKVLSKQKEYYENNREKIREQSKLHYEKNKDGILMKRRQYQEENRDKINLRKKELRNLNIETNENTMLNTVI